MPRFLRRFEDDYIQSRKHRTLNRSPTRLPWYVLHIPKEFGGRRRFLPPGAPMLHLPGVTCISMNGLSTLASISPPGKNCTDRSTSTLLQRDRPGKAKYVRFKRSRYCCSGWQATQTAAAPHRRFEADWREDEWSAVLAVVYESPISATPALRRRATQKRPDNTNLHDRI